MHCTICARLLEVLTTAELAKLLAVPGSYDGRCS
jgi:hypothetical protein